VSVGALGIVEEIEHRVNSPGVIGRRIVWTKIAIHGE
jgi:hypothetical protein